MWKCCRYNATLVACLRNICRHNVLLWKLRKLFRTATSLCPLLLQMSNYMLLFILLKMHFLRTAFFSCFSSICGVCPLPTAFKRCYINTEVFAKWTWILQDIMYSKTERWIWSLECWDNLTDWEVNKVLWGKSFIFSWWIWERHCPFYSLSLLLSKQKWWCWLLWIALRAVDKLWHIRMR